MNNALYDITAHIDEDILSATIDKPLTVSSKTHWTKWIAVAACLGICVAIAGITGIIGGRFSSSNIARSETDRENPISVQTSVDSENIVSELTEVPTSVNTEAEFNNAEQKISGYVQERNVTETVVPSVENKQEETETKQGRKKNEVITAENNGQKGSAGNSVYYFWWNNLSINGALKNAIDNNPNGKFKVLAIYKPTTADITSFEYEGKTLSEWAVAAYEEDATADAKKEYKLAYNAYLETVMPSFVNQLSNNNISSIRTEYANNAILIDVTEEQLKNLPLSNLENWVFDLASGDMKGIPNA